MDDMSPDELQVFVQALPLQVRRTLAAQIARARRDGMLRAAEIAENVHPSAASAVGKAHMRSYRDAITHAIRAGAKAPA